MKRAEGYDPDLAILKELVPVCAATGRKWSWLDPYRPTPTRTLARDPTEGRGLPG